MTHALLERSVTDSSQTSSTTSTATPPHHVAFEREMEDVKLSKAYVMAPHTYDNAPLQAVLL